MITLVAFDCGAAFPLENRTVSTIITEHLDECGACERLDKALDQRNEEYSAVANMGDLDPKRLNKIGGVDNYPFEVSGDAIALHKENQS